MKHLTAAAALALTAACAAAPGALDDPLSAASTVPAAVVSDPPRDAAHPARNRQLVIASGPVRPELGRPAEMNALFFLAAGPGPKPTMLLLHGLPGNERNLDLAQAVRRAGWNVLTFTYRGAWGSEGTFSVQHAVADAGAALALVRSPEAAKRFGVDPARIVLAGHSMGGYIAAHTAAHQAPVAGLILLDAWDIAASARQVKAAGEAGRAGFIAAMDDVGRALGPITAADLADSLIRRGEEWDLAALAPRLGRVPVLTLYATHGGALEENQAFARALTAAGAKVAARELDTDHAFADKRIALSAEVVRWLEAVPGE